MSLIFHNLNVSMKKCIFITKAKGTIQYPCKITLSQSLLKSLMTDDGLGTHFMF